MALASASLQLDILEHYYILGTVKSRNSGQFPDSARSLPLVLYKVGF